MGGILLLAIGLVTGCASASQAEPASGDAGPDGAIELRVLNRTSGPVTVFVLWRDGPRVRLGELQRRGTRTFMTPYRGPEFFLSLDVLGSPSRGTTSGALAFSGRENSLAGGSNRQGRFIPVYPGERYEWEIRTTVPSVDLFYRRLLPN